MGEGYVIEIINKPILYQKNMNLFDLQTKGKPL